VAADPLGKKNLYRPPSFRGGGSVFNKYIRR
jgi:hypothetical protein